MKLALSFVFVIGYGCILYWGLPTIVAVSPYADTWFSTALAIVFVWLFLVVSHGKTFLAFSVVAFFTVIFPLATMIFIGWGAYPSVWVEIKVIFSSFIKYAPLRGFEIFLPLLGSWVLSRVILQRLALTRPSSVTGENSLQ